MSLGVGLYIVYGKMGAGKTNYTVNHLLKNTQYKKVIANIKFSEDFKNNQQYEIIQYDKYDVKSVVSSVNPENSNSFIIIDEAQLVLNTKGSAVVKSFANACTRIRQDNQVVVLITQSSEFLPDGIRDLVNQCFKITSQKQKSKALEKISIVEIFQGGTDYQTKKIETTTFKLVYGNYEDCNEQPTEQPKVILGKTKIFLIILIVVFAICLFKIFSGFIGSKNFFLKRQFKKENTEEHIILPTSTQTQTQIQLENNICIRSYFYDKENKIVQYIDSLGHQNIISFVSFVSMRKCPR